MLNCFRCRAGLNTYNVTNGIKAQCGSCETVLMSLGHLMSRADSELVERLWTYIQSFRNWPGKQACPRCSQVLCEVRFSHARRDRLIHACQSCFLVGMDRETLKCFEETHRDYTPTRPARKASVAPASPGLHESVGAAVLRTVDHARWMLTKTELRHFQATTVIAASSLLLGALTLLAPFSSAQAFGIFPSTGGHGLAGGFEGSLILASLVHLDAIHLFGNLYFFLLFGARVERQLGLSRFLAFIAFSSFAAYLLGAALNPFRDTPAVGLSAIIGSLIGIALAQGPDQEVALLPGKRARSVPLKGLLVIFLVLELRAFFPKLATPVWFTLTYSAAGLLFGYLVHLAFFRDRNPDLNDRPAAGSALQTAGARTLRR